MYLGIPGTSCLVYLLLPYLHTYLHQIHTYLRYPYQNRMTRDANDLRSSQLKRATSLNCNWHVVNIVYVHNNDMSMTRPSKRYLNTRQGSVTYYLCT
ncbi:hypothetical protein F4775DRAFT_558143 [Biscogniauxia sp. FL1348]|nr:hypothetical protein F4775DRAFT_558143 [Biscogniauxia sp. FL1348]